MDPFGKKGPISRYSKAVFASTVHDLGGVGSKALTLGRSFRGICVGVAVRPLEIKSVMFHTSTLGGK